MVPAETVDLTEVLKIFFAVYVFNNSFMLNGYLKNITKHV